MTKQLCLYLFSTWWSPDFLGLLFIIWYKEEYKGHVGRLKCALSRMINLASTL